MEEQINLNSIVFNEIIDKELILSKISQEDIYTYYIGESIISGTTINSPLRNDNVPSFAIYYHKNNSGVLMFYDFATKDTGDCIIFVCKLFGIDYKDALLKICYDFKLSDIKITGNKSHLQHAKKVIQKDAVKLGIKQRLWKIRDKSYWSQFGITKKIFILQTNRHT